MEDVINIHAETCPRENGDQLDVVLSLDGVQECKSNNVSLDIYSVKINKCRHIYPLKIIRPLNKFFIPYKPHLQSILKDFEDCHCILKYFIGDNPKRSTVREALNHASNYACEYCVSKAERYIEKNFKLVEEKKKNELQIRQFEKQIHDLKNTPGTTEALKKQDQQIQVLNDLVIELKKKNSKLFKTHNHPVWPQNTCNGAPRTQDDIESIAQMLEEGGTLQLTADDVKGIVGRSLFLDVPNFDFVHGIPVEYMHVSCLGVVKRSFNFYCVNKIIFSTYRHVASRNNSILFF